MVGLCNAFVLLMWSLNVHKGVHFMIIIPYRCWLASNLMIWTINSKYLISFQLKYHWFAYGRVVLFFCIAHVGSKCSLRCAFEDNISISVLACIKTNDINNKNDGNWLNLANFQGRDKLVHQTDDTFGICNGNCFLNLIKFVAMKTNAQLLEIYVRIIFPSPKNHNLKRH